MTTWTVRLDVQSHAYQDIEADKHIISESGDLQFFTINSDGATWSQSHTYARGRWISVTPTFRQVLPS